MTQPDTIFAVSSGPPPAGVAVVRISGPLVRFGLGTIIKTLPKPGRHQLTTIQLADGDVLDQAVVLFFAGPASFTGEDVVEIQCHGSVAVLRRLERELGSLAGFRPAEAGEFTRRAFLNGRLDLLETEGLADLIQAETEMQRRQAMRQSRGGLSSFYGIWQRELTSCRALLEAELDFADEDDVPEAVADSVAQQLSALSRKIATHLDDGRRGERLRSGIDVVLAGPPNVGKSSLLNALVQRDAAIVTPIAGTTRDLVSVHLDLAGYPINFTDTAGLRDSMDPVEAEGIKRAGARLQTADLVIWLVDGTSGVAERPPSGLSDAPTWVVVTKIDLLAAAPVRPDGFAVSAKTGAGLAELLDALSQFVRQNYAVTGDPSLTNDRHRRHIERCLAAISEALEAPQADIQAELLRTAAQELGRLTGAVDPEDILDVIFSQFCIGK